MSRVVLPKHSKFSCACDKCVGACLLRPCWGTPTELARIIKQGYGDRLTADYWIGSVERIYILAPARTGYEGRHAPAEPRGRCTFLTADNKCLIHEIKPREGAVVGGCRTTVSDHHAFRARLAEMWNKPYGVTLVQRWAKQHNVTLRRRPDLGELYSDAAELLQGMYDSPYRGTGL